jgi:hypothetical protein
MTYVTLLYDFSHWSHAFETEEQTELSEILEILIARLKEHQSFFHRVIQEAGTVCLFCGVVAAGNSDEILSHHLLSQLAELKIDLRLDVYPSQSSDK